MKTTKKLFVLGVALLSLFGSANAQQTVTRQVTETRIVEDGEAFRPHWYLLPQAGAAYTLGETKFKDLISPAASLSAGYQFSPVFGLRFGASGWQGKGSWVSPRNDYKFNFVQANLDAVLSFTNLFMGYNPSRVIDVYGFLGIGGTYGFHNDDVEALVAKGYGFEKAWSGHRWFLPGRGGLGIDFNVSNHVALNLEVNANGYNDHFNSKKGSSADWQFNAFVGVKINFGGRNQKVTRVEEVVTYVEEPAPAPEPEPAPAPAPKPVEKPAPVKMQQDVFFTLNSTRIRTAEQAKIDELVKFMQDHPATKVVITGYADKNTGTSAYNMKISKLRAMKVADALGKAGIAASRITIDYKGSSVQPFDVNRENRVAICIAND